MRPSAVAARRRSTWNLYTGKWTRSDARRSEKNALQAEGMIGGFCWWHGVKILTNGVAHRCGSLKISRTTLGSVELMCLIGIQPVTVICHLSATEPFRSFRRPTVRGTICQLLLHLLSHYTLSGAASRLSFFSAIFSGHHCDTWVNLAIALSIYATIKID